MNLIIFNILNKTRINYFVDNKYESIRKEITKVIDVYYNTKAKLNNVDNSYKNYKLFIEYDENIKVVEEILRIYNNYKINDLFINRIENIKIIEINILKIYIRIQVL